MYKKERYGSKKVLESRNLSRKEFAEMVGVISVHDLKLHHLARKPSMETGRMIEKVTKGKVTIDDLLSYWKAKENMVESLFLKSCQ